MSDSGNHSKKSNYAADNAQRNNEIFSRNGNGCIFSGNKFFLDCFGRIFFFAFLFFFRSLFFFFDSLFSSFFSQTESLIFFNIYAISGLNLPAFMQLSFSPNGISTSLSFSTELIFSSAISFPRYAFEFFGSLSSTLSQ